MIYSLNKCYTDLCCIHYKSHYNLRNKNAKLVRNAQIVNMQWISRKIFTRVSVLVFKVSVFPFTIFYLIHKMLKCFLILTLILSTYMVLGCLLKLLTWFILSLIAYLIFLCCSPTINRVILFALHYLYIHLFYVKFYPLYCHSRCL